MQVIANALFATVDRECKNNEESYISRQGYQAEGFDGKC